MNLLYGLKFSTSVMANNLNNIITDNELHPEQKGSVREAPTEYKFAFRSLDHYTRHIAIKFATKLERGGRHFHFPTIVVSHGRGTRLN